MLKNRKLNTNDITGGNRKKQALKSKTAIQSTKLRERETTLSKALQPFPYEVLAVSACSWFPNFPMTQVMEILPSSWMNSTIFNLRCKGSTYSQKTEWKHREGLSWRMRMKCSRESKADREGQGILGRRNAYQRALVYGRQRVTVPPQLGKLCLEILDEKGCLTIIYSSSTVTWLVLRREMAKGEL